MKEELDGFLKWKGIDTSEAIDVKNTENGAYYLFYNEFTDKYYKWGYGKVLDKFFLPYLIIYKKEEGNLVQYKSESLEDEVKLYNRETSINNLLE